MQEFCISFTPEQPLHLKDFRMEEQRREFNMEQCRLSSTEDGSGSHICNINQLYLAT